MNDIIGVNCQERVMILGQGISTLTRTILEASRDISKLRIPSVSRLHVLQRIAHKHEPLDDGKSVMLTLQIGFKVSILSPGADYRHQSAETICMTINRQDISMMESRAYSEFTSYFLQNSNLWLNRLSSEHSL